MTVYRVSAMRLWLTVQFNIINVLDRKYFVVSPMGSFLSIVLLPNL